jgi:hypothetical protein
MKQQYVITIYLEADDQQFVDRYFDRVCDVPEIPGMKVSDTNLEEVYVPSDQKTSAASKA